MATGKHKKSKRKKLFDAFPKIDQSKLLQNAVTLLHEVQKQAEDIRGAGSGEINKMLLKFKDSYQDIGQKATVMSDEAKKQALIGAEALADSWDKNKQQFPPKFTKEVDRILGKMGFSKKKKSTAAKTKASKAAKPVRKAKKTTAKVKVAVKPKTKRATAAASKSRAKPKRKASMAAKSPVATKTEETPKNATNGSKDQAVKPSVKLS